jgi:hypothetical protein
MYARVATFEGATGIDEAAKEVQESERPEGVPATEIFLLTDRATGKVVVLTLYDTEEDMRKGDEAFNAMDGPGDTFGKRVGVDLLEVAAHRTD